jgi:hypothetical protein
MEEHGTPGNEPTRRAEIADSRLFQAGDGNVQVNVLFGSHLPQGPTAGAGVRVALPSVTDSGDLDARVHRAVSRIPYVHRDAEDEARRHLESGRPVLLVGSSMVGKTRMAVTLLRTLFPDRGVVIPDSADALVGLDGADVAPRDSVIYLDDVERLIGSDGITDSQLRRLAAAGNAIIGTIRAAEYDRYQPTKELRPPGWDTLNVFERVFLSRELSAAEQARLAGAVDDLIVRERIIRTGLGEYVGAAKSIEDALTLGPSVNPGGYALRACVLRPQMRHLSLLTAALLFPGGCFPQ